MAKHNNMIPNGHFHKKWQRYVKTWFDQPFKKIKRRRYRKIKAKLICPRPCKGPLRPVIHCPTIRYNRRCRAGRGFSLQELKAANLNKKFARTIGIAVDNRRRNKSVESVLRNKQRLKEYLAKMILYPKNPKKPQKPESSVDECKNMQQYPKEIIPYRQPKIKHKAVQVKKYKNFPAYKTVKAAREELKKKKSKRLKKNTPEAES